MTPDGTRNATDARDKKSDSGINIKSLKEKIFSKNYLQNQIFVL